MAGKNLIHEFEHEVFLHINNHTMVK